MIPDKYTCQGAEVSPPLKVANIPSGAKSLAIIVHDPDAPHPGGVTHWVAWNLPVNGVIPENFKGGAQGQNSDKKTGYKGMCPPTGTHRYNFRVYALDATLQLDSTTGKAALEAAMQGHILAGGVLMGRYSKGK
jgi:Raf kinase inhibitor-like YbhB/YbcL family protein